MTDGTAARLLIFASIIPGQAVVPGKLLQIQRRGDTHRKGQQETHQARNSRPTNCATDSGQLRVAGIGPEEKAGIETIVDQTAIDEGLSNHPFICSAPRTVPRPVCVDVSLEELVDISAVIRHNIAGLPNQTLDHEPRSRSSNCALR